MKAMIKNVSENKYVGQKFRNKSIALKPGEYRTSSSVRVNSAQK